MRVIPLIRLFVGGRRRARRYLAVCGLPPPGAPWDRLIALERLMKSECAAAARA